MSEKKVVNILLSQLEEALEERQNDRRKHADAIKPENIQSDRRKNDRRDKRAD
jgi:hypothetical protein